MSEEEDEDDNGEQTYEAWMRAGELQVGAEGETSEEARENTKDLWNKAIHDLRDMPEEERNRVGLK